MTSSRTLRPVFVLFAATLTASCSAVEGDGARFEGMARHVASIPLEGEAASTATVPSSAERGLRPAFSADPARPGALVVEVMDPHDFWDARDGLRRPLAAAEPVTSAAIQLAGSGERSAPALDLRLKPASEAPVIRRPPAAARPDRVVRPVRTDVETEHRTIQLGAYSSLAAAQAAWTELRTGRASRALTGLQPDFVSVQVNGKAFMRLRVTAPAEAAAAICRAAEVADPWCLRAI